MSNKESLLKQLCQYYLACLAQENRQEISVFAATLDKTKDYFELPSWPLLKDLNFSFSNLNIGSLYRKPDSKVSKSSYLLGFPIRYRKFRPKNSKELKCLVEPIFIYQIEISNNKIVLSSEQEQRPIFNSAVIEDVWKLKEENKASERIDIEEAIGLSDENTRWDLMELIKKLKAARPTWPWKEEINVTAFSKGHELKLEKLEEGIYNRAIILADQFNNFTEGLAYELKKLSELNSNQCVDSALGAWILGESPNLKPVEAPSLLEVWPMNEEQREAVAQALTKPMTVITGPPGTGKSQVVTNILVNAVRQRQTVVFASKNHQAIKVVRSRVNELTPYKLVYKLGGEEYKKELPKEILEFESFKSNQEVEAVLKYEQDIFERHCKEVKELADLEKRYIDLRKVAEESEKISKEAREVITSSGIEAIRNGNLEEIKRISLGLKKILRWSPYLNKEEAIKLFWPLYKGIVYHLMNKWSKEHKEVLKLISLECPKGLPSDKTILEWVRFEAQIFKHLDECVSLNKYFEALKDLQQTVSLEEIVKKKEKLFQDYSDNSINLWKHWLSVKALYLSSSDRILLNQFLGHLKLMNEYKESDITPAMRDRYQVLWKKIPRILPCWAVSSLSIRGAGIPFEAGFFDLLIVDEASQCDIASTLPLLYRAKRVVIIGDRQQLSHITQIGREDQKLLEKHKLIDESHWMYSKRSLFDLASTLAGDQNNLILRDHYRSHADIIEFSNEFFYNKQLRVATRYKHLKRHSLKDPGVRWVNITGKVEKDKSGAFNRQEAQAVIKEILRLIENDYRGTIGVVSPFRDQANLIKKLAEAEPKIVAKAEFHKFLSNTVHSFQGDARDIIIFSPVVSKDITSGPLRFLSDNGNLFNVAITRAQAQLCVVGDLEKSKESGIGYLREFAKYTEKISQAKDLNLDTITDHGPTYPVNISTVVVSNWEKILYEALYKSGIPTRPSYPEENYVLDLVIIDGDRKLDIEVDGVKYHESWDGELCRRDQLRNMKLNELGWDVLRFWVYEVRDDLKGCVEKVRTWRDKRSVDPESVEIRAGE